MMNKKRNKGFSDLKLGVLILMVISVAINYIDRGSLSTAAPLLSEELKLSPAQLGMLFSAFFWSYALLQIFSGWLADRYNVIWVMAIGFFIWSVATAATGIAQSVGILFLLRLLLGIGESAAYPCYSKIIVSNYPEQQRGLANALIDAGTKAGPAFGTLIGGILMVRFGWRPIFIVLGLGSLLWLPAWFRWTPRGSITGESFEGTGPGFKEILSQKKIWAASAGHFCGNYFWYFLLTWMPYYLVRERGFSMDNMAITGSLAYCVTALSTTITGWLADRAIAAGHTPTRIRKGCTITGLAFSSVVLGVVIIQGSAASMAILMFACLSYGIFTSSHWAITQTIAGPSAAGKWSGLQNSIANMAGVVAPAITGFVVNKTGQFFWAFAVSAGVVLIGASAYAFWLGPVEPHKWRINTQAKHNLN
jgi:MFS transporter, ACS family, D-galactonate transporter